MQDHKFPYGRKCWLDRCEMDNLVRNIQKRVPRYNGEKLKSLKNIKELVLDIHNKFFPELFICEVEIDENPLSIEPVIAHKQKIGGTDENPILKTMYTNERRQQVITSVDLITILVKGGTLYSMDKCLCFERCDKILAEWMDKCLTIKNEGKLKNLPAMTALGKLLANGTYGQTLKQDRHEVTKFVDSEW